MRGKPVICNETEVVYNTMSAAEKELGLKAGSISTAIKNEKAINGYTFSYYTEEEQKEEQVETPVESEVKDTVEPFSVVDAVEPFSGVDPEATDGNIEEAEFDIDETLEAKQVESKEQSKLYEPEKCFSYGDTTPDDEFMRELNFKLKMRGYDCGVVSDEFIFFRITDEIQKQQLHDILLEEGYRGWYSITSYDSTRYLELQI